MIKRFQIEPSDERVWFQSKNVLVKTVWNITKQTDWNFISDTELNKFRMYLTLIFYVESILANQYQRIAHSYQKFWDWDLKLLQATQHQGSHDWQIQNLPVLLAWNVNFNMVALLSWLLYAI